MNKNIYLIGVSGCGKSMLGSKLAIAMDFDLYDTDCMIEDIEKKTINEIFNEFGEEHFRKLEKEILQTVSNLKNAIISTGGGTVVSEDNRRIMKENGFIVFIDRDINMIAEHIDNSNRPLLKDKKKLFDLYKERYNIYKEIADISFEYNEWDSSEEIFFNNFFNFIKKYI